jgi:hypothetical protein
MRSRAVKIRDYVFWTALTCFSLVAGTFVRESIAHHAPPQPVRPATSLEKFTYWLALWRLAHAAPQAMPPLETFHQELPDAVVNAPPDRTPGPDGHPLINHGAGW